MPGPLFGLLWGICAASLWTWGCGPSIQSIHEGAVRFEHCYRLDLDPKIAPAHRHACWEQWLKVYSYGQPRDRFEHARSRLMELEAGDPNPPRLNLEANEERAARQFYMSTPAPVNVDESPPPVAPVPREVSTPPEGDPCVTECWTARETCRKRCGTEPGTPGRQGGQADTSGQDQTKPSEKTASPAAVPQPESAESATSECACEQDYMICGARCFE